EPDGTIIDANDSFLAAMGYSRDEVVGRHHRMFADPKFAESNEYADFWKQLGGGRSFTGEFQRFAKGGMEVWINATYSPVQDESGQTVRIVKYLFDITGLKKREAEASRLLAMIECMPIAVMYVDRDLVVRYANPASIDLLKKVQHAIPIQPDQLIGTCIDRFHKDPSHQRRLLDDPSNLPITTQIELGGETLSFSVSAIFDDDRNYIGAMASGRVMSAEVQTKAKATDVSTRVATSVEQMGASIEEISDSVSRTANLARDVEGMANQTESHATELSQSSTEIGEVVNVIQDFADQTNLLALNATIEAARAGENGRSFAVVANEVKQLASETAKAANSIDESVRQIQGSIVQVVDSTKNITQGISEVSTNTTTVASAIEEQSVTMAELGKTANELRQVTTDA
ncbi:MAG: methyl-accepting chemotaxis protein, partial [Planctomycetota bacterium]